MSGFHSRATTWDDGSETCWTLTTSSAAVASAILAVPIAFAINYPTTFINALFFIFFLPKRSNTQVDDQINILALGRSPVALLASLVIFLRRMGRSDVSSLRFAKPRQS